MSSWAHRLAGEGHVKLRVLGRQGRILFQTGGIRQGWRREEAQEVGQSIIRVIFIRNQRKRDDKWTGHLEQNQSQNSGKCAFYKTPASHLLLFYFQSYCITLLLSGAMHHQSKIVFGFFCFVFVLISEYLALKKRNRRNSVDGELIDPLMFLIVLCTNLFRILVFPFHSIMFSHFFQTYIIFSVARAQNTGCYSKAHCENKQELNKK